MKLNAYLCGQYWFSGDPYNPKFPFDIFYFSPMGLAIKMRYESMYKDSSELFAWVADGDQLTTFSLHNHERATAKFDILEVKDNDELNLKLVIGEAVFFGNRYIDDLSKARNLLVDRLVVQHPEVLARLHSVMASKFSLLHQQPI